MDSIQAKAALEQILEAHKLHQSMPNDSTLVEMAHHYLKVEEIHHSELVWSQFILITIIAIINLIALWLILTLKYRKDQLLKKEKQQQLLATEKKGTNSLFQQQYSITLSALRKKNSFQKLLEKIDSINNSVLNESEWSNFKNDFQNHFPNFRESILEYHPKLSLVQYRICILIKCDFTPAQIAQLIGRSRSTVSMARSELFLRITGQKGTPSDFDALVKQF
jgi:hypothetical protein